MNKAIAMGMLMRLSRLEKELSAGLETLPKSDKEEYVRQIRTLRKELHLPDLPDYNTEGFKDALGDNNV